MKNRGITVFISILCLTLVLASPAMAAQKPVTKTGMGANYDGPITVNAPLSINLGVMTVGGITTGQSNPDGSITTDSTNWTVTVKDTLTAPGKKGYMTNTSTTDQLHHELQIGKDLDHLNSADNGFTYSGSGNSNGLFFYVSQTIEINDDPGTYSITITFAGSPH